MDLTKSLTLFTLYIAKWVNYFFNHATLMRLLIYLNWLFFLALRCAIGSYNNFGAFTSPHTYFARKGQCISHFQGNLINFWT